MPFSKKFKMEFLNSFFHFPKTKTKQKKENWNAFTNSISLIGDPGMKIRRSHDACICCKHARGEGEWRIERKIRKSQIHSEGLAVMFPVSWISKFCGLFSRLVKHMQFLFVIFKHCLDACLDINTFYVTAWKKALFIWWRS